MGKAGRPPLGADVVPFHIRVPKEDRDRWAEAAEAAGKPLSEWARAVLDRAAKRQIG